MAVCGFLLIINAGDVEQLITKVTHASYGSHLSTGTAIGYDSLGTEGQLTAREGTNVGIYSKDIGCLDASVGSQVVLTQGIPHSSTRAEKGIVYDFSSQGKGSVEVGCNAVPISSNTHGTYSQHLKLDAWRKSTRGDGEEGEVKEKKWKKKNKIDRCSRNSNGSLDCFQRSCTSKLACGI